MYVESSLQLDMCIVHKLSLGLSLEGQALGPGFGPEVKSLVVSLALRVKPLRLVPLLTSLTETNRHTDYICYTSNNKTHSHAFTFRT